MQARIDRSSLFAGTALCIGIAAVAFGLQQLEAKLLGRAYIEAIVIAILLGALLRVVWKPGPRWTRGIDFSAKTLLEFAVAMLGASISIGAIVTQGPSLLVGVAIVVAASILASYAIGRAFGLSRRLALLVACGNSICGNSAIAAVAPVIKAEPDDIISSIAFTAILGVAVVLLLPFLDPLLRLSEMQYGIVAGLTVYAVPQVLAATFPVGILATQIGTLVKLMRVLMLGPTLFLVSLGARRWNADREGNERLGSFPFARLVPWFILVFLLLAGLRSAGLVPHALLGPVVEAAAALTIVAMAALGLCVDFRDLRRAGLGVMATALLAILLLGAISILLIRVLSVA
jgi:uncharacterized integral membrane protein (TIGR00698 family)